MAHFEWTPKVVALTVVGFVATILFTMSVTLFWRHEFQSAIWRFGVGLLLVVIFFQHRKFAFSIVALSLLFVNAAVPLQLSFLGITTALVSGALLCALGVWATRRYPHLKRGDLNKFFDRDPE